MFSIEDYVFNQTTGHVGKVIGYGHQILKSGYTTTLKVLIIESETSSQRRFVEEDLYSAWVQWAGTTQGLCINKLDNSSTHPSYVAVLKVQVNKTCPIYSYKDA